MVRSWSLGDVGFIGALLSVLAFQGLRHDPLESEKICLLILCSVLMLADLLTLSRAHLRRWQTNPVILAVMVVALVTLVSSGFALSLQRALVGSGFRSYGWIAIACETILVLYVAAFGARLRSIIAPLLALTAVPLCLYALYQVFNASAPLRPGSTAANPNYLAAWLGLCFVWVLPSALSSLKRQSLDGCWLLTGLWAVLVLITLNLTGSRAAFIGLILAGAAGIMLWGTLRRNKLPLIGLAVIGLILAGLLAFMQSGSSGQRGLARLIEPVDDFRQAAWTDSLYIVGEMTTPLLDNTYQPDRWARLRPLIGYGLDNLDMLRGRMYQSWEVTSLTTPLDRMHSLLYDTLLSTGMFGLIAQGLVFEAIWLSLLYRAAVLSSRRDMILCISLQVIACGGIGLFGLSLGWTMGVSLVLAMLGFIVGLLLWLSLATWQHRSAPPVTVSPWLIGLFCGSVFYFACQLFGFQQIVSAIPFAALIGFCATDLTNDEGEAPRIDSLLLVLALVTVFAASLLRALTAPTLLLIVSMLMGAWIVALWVGIAPKTTPKKTKSNAVILWLESMSISWQKGALYGCGLLVLLLIVYQARESLSLAMNQTLLAAPASSLSDLTVQASGHGMLTLLCYVYAGWLIWQAGHPRGLVQSRRGAALTIACLIGAGIVFLASSTGHLLWNTAATLDSISGGQYAAEMSYQGAEQLLPWTQEIWVEHLRFLQTPSGTELGLDPMPVERTLYTLNPFYDNQIRGWQ